jgi:hypothetical protein
VNEETDMNTQTVGTVALAVAIALGVGGEAEAAPTKAALFRTWELEGSDTVGAYTGSLEVTDGGRRKVALVASLSYADGTQRTWSSSGYYAFGRIYCRYTLSSGLAGLGASAGERVRGILVPDRLARQLSSTYTGATFTGEDEAYRPWRAGLGFRWTPRIVKAVLEDVGLSPDWEDALLAEAADHDDGNGFLKRSELEAGAAALFVDDDAEVGIISDIDKTVLPPHDIHATGPKPDPYPGVVTLYTELEGSTPGDMTYVTARTPDLVTEIPAWMADHGLPEGPIETGVNMWTSQAEKVRDIQRAFDASPDQSFVLFGDSSHRDPEVYKEILALYPDRVLAVFIHKVNNVNPNRVAGMNLITNYAEAAAKLFELEILDEDAARRAMEAAQAQGLAITDAEIDALLTP